MRNISAPFACIGKLRNDLGFGVLNDYREKLPRQFINAGVAEQARAGIAAGMALEGRKVGVLYCHLNSPTLGQNSQ